jgi:hypothetical protein
MLWLESGHYVRIEEMANGPQPLPLKSGFSKGMAYRVIGVFNPSETAEAYMILVNDQDETWFISNRHLRMCPIDNHRKELRTPFQLGQRPVLDILLSSSSNGTTYHVAE